MGKKMKHIMQIRTRHRYIKSDKEQIIDTKWSEEE